MNRDVVAGGVMLTLSAAYYAQAVSLPKSILDTAVDSAAFPKILGAAGIALSLALIVQGVVRRRALAVASRRSPEDWSRHLKAAGLLLIASAYIVVLELFGYAVAIMTLIPSVAIYHGMRPGPRLAAVSIAGAVLFWFFFVKLLGIHMPPGIVWRALGVAG